MKTTDNSHNIVLLSRDDFRNGVFERDNHKCVICGAPAKDAHHIIERRLFKNGGYFLDNGSSLCEKHHLEAEMTILSVEDIRNACGITTAILPEHLYEDAIYDKWGNEVLKNGTRLQGELFLDESVQKILERGNVLGDFVSRVKYSRTYHLTDSPGMNRDDRKMTDEDGLEGQYVIATEKMDGENTSWYADYTHARSIETESHPSRDWMKNLWAQKGYNIPKDWRVCGENLYAKHAIHYSKENNNALMSYFYMFSVYDDRNVCLSWKETKEWAELLELTLVPVLFEGIWTKEAAEKLNKHVDSDPNIEGYVVRVSKEFHYSEFRRSCGKYVRANHVQNNHGHWSRQKITKNELK